MSQPLAIFHFHGGFNERRFFWWTCNEKWPSNLPPAWSLISKLNQHLSAMSYPLLKPSKFHKAVWIQKIEGPFFAALPEMVFGRFSTISQGPESSLQCACPTHCRTQALLSATCPPTEICPGGLAPPPATFPTSDNGAPWVAPLYSCTSWGATVGPSEMTGSKWAKAGVEQGPNSVSCSPKKPRNCCWVDKWRRRIFFVLDVYLDAYHNIPSFSFVIWRCHAEMRLLTWMTMGSKV